jgi:hypothetical protein
MGGAVMAVDRGITASLTRADAIRGFYHHLGIELDKSGHENASCHCFANPEAHAHADQRASCSVSLRHGAWHCWGCDAKGGAFDAATSRGLTNRQAFDLKVQYGLAERRTGSQTSTAPPAVRLAAPQPPPRFEHPPLEQQRLQQQLVDEWEALPLRLEQRQLWRLPALLALGCGWDGQRITMPVQDRSGDTIGLLRYLPDRRNVSIAKVLADSGTHIEPLGVGVGGRGPLVLTEGIPDLLSARSAGLPAAGISGVQAWRPAFARRFLERRMLIAFDADRAGRNGADRVLLDLGHAGVDATILDLAPRRSDGYDLTNWLSPQRTTVPAALLRSLADHAHRPTARSGRYDRPPAPPRSLSGPNHVTNLSARIGS